MARISNGCAPLALATHFKDLRPAPLVQHLLHRILAGFLALGAVQTVVDGEQALSFERGVESVGSGVLLQRCQKVFRHHHGGPASIAGATSTCARPAACLCPCAISRSACCTFFCDQLERARRGVIPFPDQSEYVVASPCRGKRLSAASRLISY